VPLDLQKINSEIQLSTFTLLLARFSGKLSRQQLGEGFSLETRRSATQGQHAEYSQRVWARTQDETRGRCPLPGALLEAGGGGCHGRRARLVLQLRPLPGTSPPSRLFSAPRHAPCPGLRGPTGLVEPRASGSPTVTQHDGTGEAQPRWPRRRAEGVLGFCSAGGGPDPLSCREHQAAHVSIYPALGTSHLETKSTL